MSGTPDPAARGGGGPPPLRARLWRWWTAHVWNAPWAVFLVLLAGAIAAYLYFWWHPGQRIPALRGYAVVLLTLAPALLYLRFVRFRLLPVCVDYVYNLHRLRVDDPKYLPEPPRGSRFHDRWVQAGGAEGSGYPDNVYRVKFRTHYTRWPRQDGIEHAASRAQPAAAGEHRGHPADDVERSSASNLMALYVYTATAAAGWAAVIWYLPEQASATGLSASERFGFLGAYFYVLSMLVRRYFQSDLRLAAYITGTVRVLTVVVLVAAVEQAWGVLGDPGQPTRNVVAFLIGVFPSVAMQLLRRSVGKVTGWLRGGLEPPLPLGQLDGMDIWTEARLLEVGIEDVQHLATTSFVDLCLATRIETQRLVDWVDQGLLLLYAGVPRLDNVEEQTTYRQLRDLGVRSAWQLVRCVDRLGLDVPPGGPYETLGAVLREADAMRSRRAKGAARAGAAPPPATGGEDTRLGYVLALKAVVIAHAVRDHPNLNLIRNWYADGFPEDADAAAAAVRTAAGAAPPPAEPSVPSVPTMPAVPTAHHGWGWKVVHGRNGDGVRLTSR